MFSQFKIFQKFSILRDLSYTRFKPHTKILITRQKKSNFWPHCNRCQRRSQPIFSIPLSISYEKFLCILEEILIINIIWWYNIPKKSGDLRYCLVKLGVTLLWHVDKWVSRAPPHHTLPAFLNLNDILSQTYQTVIIFYYR